MKGSNIALSVLVMIFMLLAGCTGESSTPPRDVTADTTAPSIPTGLTATAAGSSSIALNWNASTDDVAVTGYKVYRGGSQIATSTNNSYTDTGLSSSTTYTYTVAVYDAAGNNSAQSAAASATTLAAGQTDTQAPTAPTNLTATPVSSSQINLSWTASTDDVGVAGYEVWRGETKIATVTTASYSDTGLEASTTYSYAVKAFDGASNVSNASSQASATTQAVGNVGSLRVRIVRAGETAAAVPDATVVLGDSNGTMLAYGTTDANGEYTFNNPPVNATVTGVAAYATSGNFSSYYALCAAYDVNVAAVTLDVHSCDNLGDASSTTSTVGNVTVNVTNSLSAAVKNTVFIGGIAYKSDSLVTQQTYSVYSDYLQSDGKLSVFILGYDADDKAVSYGYLLDQTFTDGMTVNVLVDQPMSLVQYELTNSFSITPKQYYYDARFAYSRMGITLPASKNVNSTIIRLSYIPDIADKSEYNITAYVTTNNNDAKSAMNFHGWGGDVFLDQTLDKSSPVFPTDPVVSYATGTATPTLSWSGTDSTAYRIYGRGYTNDDNYADGHLERFAFTASPARASIQFPQLPDSLSSIMPSGMPFFAVHIDSSSLFTGYDDFLTKTDQLSSGTWSYPITGKIKSSAVCYDSSRFFGSCFSEWR